VLEKPITLLLTLVTSFRKPRFRVFPSNPRARLGQIERAAGSLSWPTVNKRKRCSTPTDDFLS
jgi:hypothetical protein